MCYFSKVWPSRFASCCLGVREAKFAPFLGVPLPPTPPRNRANPSLATLPLLWNCPPLRPPQPSNFRNEKITHLPFRNRSPSGGYPPELAWWTGGRPRGLQERVGRGSAKEGGRLGLGWLFQRGASAGKGWLAWQFHRRGQGLGGESKNFGSGRVGVLFFESWRVDLVTCSRRGLPRAVWCRSHCRSHCEGRTKHGLLSGDLSREATYVQQCSQFHVMP